MPPSPATDAAWTRIARGYNALLIGERAPADPSPRSLPKGTGIIPLRVDCAHRRGALAFVRELLADISRMLDTYPSRWLPREMRLDPGLRRRLVEESATQVWGGALVAALRSLAEQSRGRAALVLQGIDEASDEVAPILLELFERGRLLRMPVLMTSATEEPESETARDLIESFVAREGADSVLRAGPAPALASEAPAPSAPPPEASRAIPEEALRVLRALAIAGPDAEVEALAYLVERDPVRVLESLQSARDFGFDVHDRGDGRLSLGEEQAEALAGQLLPSLARAYHQQLAEWHGSELEPDVTELAEAEAPREAPAETVVPEAAASHAEAAGDPELAAYQYTQALREATSMGLAPQALEYGRKALALIEGLPENETRRGLRIDVLATLALVHWQSAGTESDLSLEGARELLDRASALLRPSDPPSAAAELDALRAHILYDVGSRDALEQALAAVTRASRAWQAQNEPVRAAQLLNDEAAIWVRLGDPVRANTLLTQSLELFGNMRNDDPTTRAEEAETRLLLARLVFHVDAKPGRERDAVELAIGQASAAEEIYQELEHPREAARARETIGRLHQILGESDVAEEHLRDAATAQQELGDPLGLARTSAALAEISAARGDAGAALELLGHSVELNAVTGTPLGLAYNRQALEALAPGLPKEASLPVEELFARIEEAESLVGRTKLAR